MNSNRENLACKNGPKMWGNEASHSFWPQTAEGPSTMLERDPKYDILLLMDRPKTVWKQAKNTMQKYVQNRYIAQSI